MWLSIDENYECSIEGVVRNKKTMRELKQWIAGRGYLYTRIGGARSRQPAVHRVVAELFLPMPTELGLQVDHIDRNKLNNNASNLRWVSAKQNMSNLNIECKPRASNKSGNHHIKRVMSKRQINPSYAVVYHTQHFKHYSLHSTLEDAIKYRDSINVSPSKVQR